MKLTFVGCALCVFLVAACAPVQQLLANVTSVPAVVSQPTVTQIASLPPPTTTAPAEPGPTTLRLWLPPRFDPESGTPAGELLKQRLDEFRQQYPEIQLEVRLKAIGGPGGMLDSLATTSVAAPQAMPDVVALSRADLETAALKGYLHNLSARFDLVEGADWFDYARQLGQIHDSVYGIPFAGDVGLVVYRPEFLPTPPRDLSGLLESASPFLFAAADANSIFTLAQYQSRGGSTQDSQGQPDLELPPLEQVLNYYAQARDLGIMPDWLVQFEDDQEAWESFASGTANQAFTWSSNYLSADRSGLAISPAPTADASPYTPARGWVWALSSTDENRYQSALQLASFLAESQFLSAWTQAAGYLPPRPTALEAWPPALEHQVLAELSRSASLQPAVDILQVLGPPLKQAAIAVLTGESDPASAARAAVEALEKP